MSPGECRAPQGVAGLLLSWNGRYTHHPTASGGAVSPGKGPDRGSSLSACLWARESRSVWLPGHPSPSVCPSIYGWRSGHCALVFGETNGLGKPSDKNYKQRKTGWEGEGGEESTWAPVNDPRTQCKQQYLRHVTRRASSFQGPGERSATHVPGTGAPLGAGLGPPCPPPGHPESQWQAQTPMPGCLVLASPRCRHTPCILGACHLSTHLSNLLFMATGLSVDVGSRV